jgi:hypothetical protein
MTHHETFRSDRPLLSASHRRVERSCRRRCDGPADPRPAHLRRARLPGSSVLRPVRWPGGGRIYQSAAAGNRRPAPARPPAAVRRDRHVRYGRGLRSRPAASVHGPAEPRDRRRIAASQPGCPSRLGGIPEDDRRQVPVPRRDDRRADVCTVHLVARRKAAGVRGGPAASDHPRPGRFRDHRRDLRRLLHRFERPGVAEDRSSQERSPDRLDAPLRAIRVGGWSNDAEDTLRKLRKGKRRKEAGPEGSDARRIG